MNFLRPLFVIVACLVAAASSAQVFVSGTVKTVDNEPLIGALLTIKGADCIIMTNSYGQFSSAIPEELEGSQMVVSYYGYQNDTLPVKSGNYDIVLVTKVLETFNNITYVSTQKRLQSNVEVPITLSVFDFNKLGKLNIYEPQELSLYTPGYHNQTQSGVYSVNVIRGVASDGSNSYSFFQPRISVFLDGVSITHMGTASTDFFDMQRVEVVKGPQGTLFGKGAMFGAVNYVPNKPSDEFAANFQLNYGSYNQKIVQAMVNTPVKPGVSNRFAFYYNDRDGYNTNLADNSDLSGKGAISLRDIFKWKFRDNVNMMLSVDYERNREPSVSLKGNRVGTPDDPSNISPFTPAYFDSRDLFVSRDMGGVNYTFEHKLNSQLSYTSTTAIRAYKLHERYDLDGTFHPVVVCDESQNGFQLSEELRLNWEYNEKLSAFGGFSYMYDRNKHEMKMHTNLKYSFPYLVSSSLAELMQTIPAQLLSALDGATDQVMSEYYKMLPQYVDRIKPYVGKFKELMFKNISETLTAEYSRMLSQPYWDVTPDLMGRTSEIVTDIVGESIRQVIAEAPEDSEILQFIDPATLLSGLGLDNIFAPLMQYSNLELNEDYQENETDINVYQEGDIFADATYKLTDKLFFTLGLRGTVERQKTSYCSTSDFAPLVGAFIYHGTNGETHWLHDFEISWVGRAVANYMITKNTNAYLSFSKGRRPGSIYYNFKVEDAVKLQPETSLNYELGLKGSLIKNHVSYTLAGYKYYWQHFQSQVTEEGDNGIRTYVNNDKGMASAQGVELSTEGYFRRFAWFFDYSYIDAKFSDEDSDGNAQELAGNRFRMTPKSTFDFGLDFDIPLRKKAFIYIRPTFSWVSDMYFSHDNNEMFWQDSYGLANFTIGTNITHNRTVFDFYIYGKNIADEQYLLDAGNTGQMLGYPTFIAGTPRMFGIGMSISFN